MIRSVALFCVVCLIASPTALAASASKAACTAPVYRQFDFFAGDWDAYDMDAPGAPVARNQVEVTLDGCVIHEDYHQNDGLHGESYSLYDAARGVWHQSWVTNRGELLLLDGGLRDGQMAFDGTQRAKDGKAYLVHVAWIPQGGNVRETATHSGDGGKSWQPLFDVLFKPHRH